MKLGRPARRWWRAAALSAGVMLVLLYWNYNNTSSRAFAEELHGERVPATAAHQTIGLLLLISVLVVIYTLTFAVITTVNSRPRRAPAPSSGRPGAERERAEALQTLAQMRADGLLTPEEFDREVTKLDQRP